MIIVVSRRRGRVCRPDQKALSELPVRDIATPDRPDLSSPVSRARRVSSPAGMPSSGHVPHAVRPHGHRHQPGNTLRAGCRAVPGRTMRHLMLELVVDLDGEGHQCM